MPPVQDRLTTHNTKHQEIRLRSRGPAVVALSISLLSVGCATVDKTAFSPESRKKIKTIALISVPEPEKYSLAPGQLPGGAALYMFGALGGLVLGGIEASRFESATNEFTASIKPLYPGVAQHWNESLITLLQSKGYEVTQLPKLPIRPDGKDVDCASVTGKFDAVLLSTISPGYAVEASTEPRIVASVRLVSSSCSDTHYTNGFVYSSTPMGKLTHIGRDVNFSFSSREALISDPQKAREALRTGLGEIAKRAAEDL